MAGTIICRPDRTFAFWWFSSQTSLVLFDSAEYRARIRYGCLGRGENSPGAIFIGILREKGIMALFENIQWYNRHVGTFYIFPQGKCRFHGLRWQVVYRGAGLYVHDRRPWKFLIVKCFVIKKLRLIQNLNNKLRKVHIWYIPIYHLINHG